MKIAILDDYLDVVGGLADWKSLAPAFQHTIFTDHLEDEDAIVERLRDFDVVVTMRERTPFPRSLLARLPKLSLLATLGVSNPALDLVAASDLGVVVSGTTGSGPDPIELTWGLILASARFIPQEDRATREGAWQTRIGMRLSGRTLGVMGLGKIGGKVARIGEAFGMHVIAWSPNLTRERATAAGVEFAEKDELLASADVVTLHLRLGDSTRGTIGRRELDLMKRTAMLVNTARSRLVDEAALIDALRDGRIAAAALDVFDQEPLPPDHPLRSLENTVITPHLGGVTTERYRTDYAQIVDAIRAFAAGNPQSVLNADVLDRPGRRRL